MQSKFGGIKMLKCIFQQSRNFLKSNTPEEQVLFVLIKMLPEISKKKLGVSAAFVIDTSGSMSENDNSGKRKIDTVVDSFHKLIDSSILDENNKLSLIKFSDYSEVVMPLTDISDKEKIHKVIEKIRIIEGGTLMGKGMKNAYDELKKLNSPQPKRVILLTDGETFDEEDCIKEAGRLSEINAPILSIGVGVTYNQELLLRISDMTRGKHLHLQNPDELEKFFLDELKISKREVITNLKAFIEFSKGVRIESIHKVYPNITNIENTNPYTFGNIQVGDYTIFLLKLVISGLSRPNGKTRILQAKIYGDIPEKNASEFLFGTYEVFVEFSNREENWRIVDQEVLDYVAQLNVGYLIGEANKLTNIGDISGATKKLEEAMRITQRLGNSALTENLSKAINEVAKTHMLSEESKRTLVANSRTKTIKSQRTLSIENLGISEEDIRKISGT